jgi:hypothetical protein
MGMTLRRSPLAVVPWSWGRLAPLFALLVACSSSGGGGGGGGEGACKAGANAAFATPAGRPYALPPGIALVELTGNILDKCMGIQPIEYGSDIAHVCMVVKNTTGADIELTLPAGLVFVAQNAKTQNGIILQEHKVTIKANATKNIHIRLSCINEHCKYTDAEDVYALGNVTNDKGLLEVIDLVKNKKMSPDTIPVTQEAVWSVTDRGGLTDEHRTNLKGMPAA